VSHTGGSWIWTAGGLILLLLLAVVPLPGVPLSAYELGLERAADGMLTPLLGLLVLGRLGAAATGRRRTFAAGTFVLGAWSCWTWLVELEPLLPEQSLTLPPWLSLLSMLGAGAAAWFLADRLSERGALGGTATLLLAVGSFSWLGNGFHAISLLALGQLEPALAPVAASWVLAAALRLFPVQLDPDHSEVLVTAAVLTGSFLALGLARSGPQGRGPASLGAFALAWTLLCLGGAGLASWLSKDLLQARLGASHHRGAQAVFLTYEVQDVGPPEAETLRRRLELWGLEGQVQLMADRVQVELDGVAAPRDFAALRARPGGLGLHRDPEGRTPSVLDPDQIVSASTVQGFDGRPAVLVELDEEGTRQLAELTAERVGETMALTLGGQLRMVPRVMEPITGGTLQLSLGEGEAMAEARDLTVLIEAPLGGRWTLLEVSAR
jgi:hypothetical protein